MFNMTWCMVRSFGSIYRRWLESNIATANERSQSIETIRADVDKLEKKLVANLDLTAIKYESSWNVEHIRGCLKSLDHLSKMHENVLKGLTGLYSEC